MALQLGLEDEVADMAGDVARRQPGTVGRDHVGAGDREPGDPPADHGQHAVGAIELARDRGRAHEAMRRDGHIQHRDGGRNVSLVAGEHQAKQPEIPAHDEPEGADAGEHQPAQQRQVVGGKLVFEDADGHLDPWLGVARHPAEWIVTTARCLSRLPGRLPSINDKSQPGLVLHLPLVRDRS